MRLPIHAGFVTSESEASTVSAAITEQVISLLHVLNNGEASTKMLLQVMGLKHRPSCLKNYLQPALQQNLIEMTQPDSPRSPTQKYHPTALGRDI